MPPSILATIGVALYMAAILGGIIVLIMLFSRRRSRPQQHNPAQPDQQAIPTHAPAAPPSAAAAGSRWAPTHDLPYTRQRYLLTQAERDFFAILRASTPPGWYVFPQVRLANLVMVKKGTRNWKPHFSRVAQKCVDFVLCDGEEISPRLVVELDDSSHNRPDRQNRDAFVDATLQSAGLPILHVRWQRHYDPAELAAAIQRAAGLPARIPVAAVPVAASPVPTPLPAAPRIPLTPAMHDQPMATAPATRWACRQCGATVNATAKYCTGCGAQLEL